MKKEMCILFVLFVAIFSVKVQAQDLAKHLQEISVTVRAGSSEGSGVIITRDLKVDSASNDVRKVNFVWTAGHVVDSLRSVRTVIDAKGQEKKNIEFKDAQIVRELIEDGSKVGEQKMDAVVVKYSDAENGQDLALLMIKKQNYITDSADFYLKDDIIPLGTQLFHVGSLLGQAGSNSMTPGIMSQIGRVLELGGSSGKVFDQTTVTAFPGCVTKDTMIQLVDNSFKSIVDLKEGDEVLAYDNRISMTDGTWQDVIQKGDQVLSFQTITGKLNHKTGDYNLRPVVRGKVNKVWETGIKPIYKISTRNKTVRVSGNHPFVRVVSVPAINNKIYHIAQWCRADELQIGDIVGTMLQHIQYKKSDNLNLNETFGQKSNKIEIMRLCGFYVGDGYSRVRKNEGGEVALYTFDDNDTKNYSNIIKNNFTHSVNYTTNKSGEYINIYSIEFAKMFDNLGFTGSAKTKRIPSWIFQLPKELQLSFLEGYVDADGHRNNRDYYQLEAANEKLIQDFYTLAMNIGLGTSNIYNRERTTNIDNRSISSKTWCVEVYPNPVKENAQFNGSTELLPTDLKYERISSIIKDGEEMTYDMEVDTYHNFFANGFLLHNSSGGGVFFADGENKGKYIGMLVRGAGEGFNLVVPIRRMNKWCKETGLEWTLDVNVAAPTLEELKKIRVEDSAKEANLEAVKPEEKKSFPFLIHSLDTVEK